ncbi:Bug family tripartite tricarboxylate transporter substrate binding protein [Pseudoroseomonas ludipueritiae]|uniref:Tripartite tricarboxylate transporter substrate binding protein n=1 Tax=Pseudoroseomonas ludipueritiae TaxID=198093 RepID=A0ABR7RC46_9PROT|nr:tripartite tricarboxylate transporter substrate binding protein [Pseudoroseomonas ludipueritiae]MBC9179323.1 tripartite tricarboxylate transporter substrate binding protein [Pseudoroseomonas ludipueritiae]
MIKRRTVLTAIAASAAGGMPGALRAEDNYPSRSVSILVGFAPGGGTDIIARLLAPSLQAELGQAVAVDNRAGASGTLASAATARAKPDGYTLLMGTVSTQAVVAPLMRNPPYDQDKDFTPLVLAGTVPLVAVVPANAPYRDLKGLIEFARKNPGKLNYASSGIATQQHLAAEMLCQAAGIQMTHVPYRGTGPVLNDLMAGTLDLAIDTMPTHLPHLRNGSTRALAVTMPERVKALPDVPTVAESGFPGFEITVWYMLLGPAGLPAQVTERWVQAMNKALREPANRSRLEEAGFIPGGGSAADAAELVRREAARYGALVQRAGIRVD